MQALASSTSQMLLCVVQCVSFCQMYFNAFVFVKCIDERTKMVEL